MTDEFEGLLDDLDFESTASHELAEVIFEVISSLEKSVLEARLRRLRLAFDVELRSNGEGEITHADLDRVRNLLDGYAFDDKALHRLSYGQILLLQRYDSIYRLLADADLHIPVDPRGERRDAIIGAVI